MQNLQTYGASCVGTQGYEGARGPWPAVQETTLMEGRERYGSVRLRYHLHAKPSFSIEDVPDDQTI